jgi:signal transduction histidine kinase
MSQNEYMFILLLVATCLTLFISYLSFRKRQLPVAKYSALVMLAVSFYSLGYAFEIISTDLASVKFWLKIEYIGIPFITTFWLILVMNFTGHQAAQRRWFILLLFFIPFMTIILYFTNDFHHFFYRDITVDHNNPALLSVELLKGPWYWVHISYTYLQAFAGMILFAVMYMNAIPIVRKQIMVMMLTAIAPWIFNFMYLFGIYGVDLDLTAFGFTFSGVFYIWGIYRINLHRLVPIALQRVYETMQDGVIILDYEYNITNVNQAAKDIFDDLHSLSDNMHSAYRVFADAPELLSKLITTSNSESRITIGSKGELRHYSLKISILYDKEQTILGRMLILSDITQLTVYQDELLSNANQLAELIAFKDKLFTMVAHDIRDPLAVLVNLTDLLRVELEATKSGHLNIFQEVGEQVRTTYLLIENLLDWFRSQTGKVIYNPLVWDLKSIVQQVIPSVKIRSELKKIEISSDLSDGTLVCADREMLELVLRNLLSNAVKFTPIGGTIHVGATKDGLRTTVFVRDSGAGVDPEVGKSLFHEIQHRSSSGTEGEMGTGLGLYLSQNFVHLHGGDIWFESLPDQGSTFFFTVPSYKTVIN